MSGPQDIQEGATAPVTKTYYVELSGTVYTNVEVEAEDEDEAHDKAKEQVSYAYFGWDDDVSAIQVESIAEAPQS